MPPEELAQYKQLFMQTAWDYIRQLEGSLLVLSHDRNNTEAISSVHLASHSLKSQCAVMQYHHMAEVCRMIEEMFRDSKSGSSSFTVEIVTSLQTIVGSMKESLAHISTDNQELSLDEAKEMLVQMKGVTS